MKTVQGNGEATAGFVCWVCFFFGGGGLFWFWFWFIFGHSMRDVSSLTRDQTHAPAVEVWSPNHWTTREVPLLGFKQKSEV